jgi:LTXXQ motif family protein
MRRAMLMVALMLGSAALLAGQEPTDADSPRAAQLRQQIEDRFAARAQEELGLSDEQFQHLRTTTAQFGAQRRNVEQTERRLRQAMAFQLRPGVAANQDSVAHLTDAMLTAKAAYVQTYRDEMHALAAFLDPVQRAQFFMLRERLLNLAQQVRAQRRLAQDSAGTAPMNRPLRPRRRP